jgi:hypothetical protein
MHSTDYTLLSGQGLNEVTMQRHPNRDVVWTAACIDRIPIPGCSWTAHTRPAGSTPTLAGTAGK